MLAKTPLNVYLLVDIIFGMQLNLNESEVANEILDLAQELFQERGYKAFSYKDLSEQVGIKTSSIHYYFPSKDDLAKALVVRYRGHFQKILAQIDAQTDDPKRKLELYFQLFIDSFRESKRVCLCSMLASDFANIPESVQEDVKGIFSINESWVARVLEEGRNSNMFGFKGSSERMARTIFSALEGSTISARIFENEHRLSFTSDWIMRILNVKS